MCRPGGRAGASLMELLVVIALMSLLFAGVYQVVVVGLRMADASDARESVRQPLAAALDRMTRELALCDNVDDADDDEFQCDTPDVNNVEYIYDGGDDELSRDDGDVAEAIVLRRLTAWDFDYVDDTGAALSTPVAGAQEDDIRIVQVTATVTLDAETISMTSAVYLRNM